MGRMYRGLGWCCFAAALAAGAFLAGCSDSSELAATRTELAALQTTVAAPTATPTRTPTPSPTPKPDVSELCERTFEYLYHRGRAIARDNEINGLRRYLNYYTMADKRELEALWQTAWAVFIPLPPPGAPPEATILRDKLMELRASDRRGFEAVWNSDADAANREIAVRDQLHADVRAYWAQVCLSR